MAKNIVCHVEWAVSSLDKAKAFYGGLFAWTFEGMGEEYLMFNTGSEELGGGLMLSKEVKPGQSPIIYIHVDSIETKLPEAEKLGGKVCVPKTEIPNMGWFAVLADLDGNPVGIFESAKKA